MEEMIETEVIDKLFLELSQITKAKTMKERELLRTIALLNSMIVGGEKEAYERVRPILEKMGKNIFYMGGVGMGEVAKLANNLLLLIQMNAAYEATALAEKSGLDPDLFRDMIKVSTGGSWVVEHWDMVRSWKEDYKPGGTMDLIYKDFQLALGLAQDLKTPLHLGAVASQLGRY